MKDTRPPALELFGREKDLFSSSCSLNGIKCTTRAEAEFVLFMQVSVQKPLPEILRTSFMKLTITLYK
jgi:hypothetical protein